MEKEYEPVDMEIILFDSEDVITTSGNPDCQEEGDEV